jgi:hypothetical protein
MLDGRLRIAPTCYHVLHQVPVMTADEMNFLYDEGLKAADGSLAYTILHDSMVPFGLEKLGISQAMKEKSVFSRGRFSFSAHAVRTSTSSQVGETNTRTYGLRRRISSRWRT